MVIKMRKMKIALVYDAVYPYIKGGGEKRFFEIGKGLTARGHEVHFYGMKLWEGDKVIKRDGMYYHGICQSRPLYGDDGKRSIKEAVFFGLNCFKLIRENFDIIDCCGFPYFSLFTCKLVSIVKRKQLLSTWYEVWGKDYWYDYIGLKGWIGYFIEKLASLMPDEIISISEQTTYKLKNILKSKKTIYTVPFGADLDIISKTTPAIEKSDVIFVGRLISHKNIDIFIKSIKLIKRKKPEIKALIIGDGPEKKVMEELTLKLKMRNNIKFFGFLENHDAVYALMKASKVFILPSTREGLGIVAIEANACGLPVITINHKDNAAVDLIEEGKNGFVCNLNEEEISKLVLTILDEKNHEEIKKVCMDISLKYSWKGIMDKIERIYIG